MTSSPKTILIVDDNPEDRHTYYRYLHQDTLSTYKIVEAETAEEGLELFYCHNPDLILLDFNLPDGDGLEFIAELKLSCDLGKVKALRDRLPPIIMLTGEGNEAVAVRAMKAGVKDYLVKDKTKGDNLRFAVRSVLEQARLQKLAERNEQRFRISVENMLDCFGIYSSIRDDNNRIVGFHPDYLNDAACNSMLFDWQSKSELSELTVCPYDIFDSQEGLFVLCCQVVETGKAISTEYSWQSPSWKQPDATQFFELRINKLEDGFVAVWRDISERIQIKQALQQNEIKFRALVTQAPVGIFQTDCWGDCWYVNPRWLEITGLSQEEAMGKGWSKALHPEDRARVYKEWYETAATEKEFASEYRFCNSDGKVTWVSGTAVGLYSDRKKLIGYFGTITDISDRKKSEALLQKHKKQLIGINHHLKQTSAQLEKRNRELDEFTSIVSHDLKAPLRAIHNLSEWIEEDLEDKLDDDTRQNFQLLRNRVGRMQMFIQSLLEYSRIGREKTLPEKLAVKNLLIDIIDSLDPPKTFTIVIDEPMPILKTQKIALEQVFANLISNAIKHHHTKTGKINISATETAKFYHFAVADDGAGIAPEHQERIFGIFQTLYSKDDRENTGIGLSIVKKIVENQGGKIELESRLGKGTTFRFSWRK